MSSSSENEPVNLLACDGGGIRGVSELVILDELMKVVQDKGEFAKVPKPCDYFHLMGGTSTGGLVAIMLGRLEMSTEEALKAYDSFASEIFSKRRNSLVEKYNAKTLEQTVQRLVRDQDKGSLLRDARPRDAKGRAFVCAMPEQRHRETVRLRTYDIAGDRYPNVLIYEAARATTAATTYFRPMSIRDDEGREEAFVDAALGTNNPISLCLEEAAELYGKQRTLGCLVSLGTGSRHVEMQPHGGRLIRKFRFLWSTIKLIKEIGTDSEKDHERMRIKFADFEDTYFRLNVDGGAQGIELSDWKKIGELKERTRLYLQNPEVRKSIEDLADVLLQKRPNQGLTLAHGGGLSKETTIPVQPRFIRRGKSSNIFTGREGILKRLDQHFGPRAAGDTRRREFQLHGMGGMGKTQIALKFTERNGQRFHTIMWVDATDAVTIEQSFSDIANNILGREVKKQPVEEVRRWLQQTDNEWLLVFDNAPNSGLSRYLPDGDQGNVLYTTRHRNLQPRLRPDCIAGIEDMEIQDAVQLLLASAHIATDIEANKVLAKSIVRELGSLPLAIDQAGAYIHMAPCPLDGYLKVFNEQKDMLLQNPRFKGEDEIRNLAVYATFDISYRAIKACADKKGDMERVKDAELALKLLRLICFYHNEGLLLPIFESAARQRYLVDRHIDFPLKAGNIELDEFLLTVEAGVTLDTPDGRKWVGDRWTRGMKFLHDFSLIQLDTSCDYSNMHILVHDWARNRMNDKERSQWGTAARCLLMDSLTLNGKYNDVVHRRDTMPHLQVLLKYADIAHDDLALESEYQAKMAKVFRQFHDLPAAENALQHALEHRKRVFGLLDPATFSAMSQLAIVRWQRGHYVEAEEMLLEVIDRRRLLHRENRAQGCREPGPAAQIVALEAQAFYSTEFFDDFSIRTDTESLVNILAELDSKDAAEKIVVDLVNWSESRHGLENRLTRKYHLWLTNLRTKLRAEAEEGGHQGTENLEDAREWLETKLAERGPSHPGTISAKRDLGKLLVQHENLTEALVLLGEVCKWNEQVHGVDSIQYVDAMFDYADVLLRQNRPYEADSMLVYVVGMYDKTLGNQHPKTMSVYHDLSHCHAMKADYRKAAAAMRICFEGRKEVLGLDHRLTRVSEESLTTFRNYERMVPEWTRATIKTRAVEASKYFLGDLAPQWMKDWESVSEEAIMLACAARGEPLRKCALTEKEINGMPSYDIKVIEVIQPQMSKLLLQTEAETNGREGDISCTA